MIFVSCGYVGGRSSQFGFVSSSKCKATGNANARVVLIRSSPAVLLRILLNRYYSFKGDGR